MPYSNSTNVVSLSIVIFLFCLATTILSKGVAYAQNYREIIIHPTHVGVFTTDGEQQFVAYGVDEIGNYHNLTRNVSWESSNENLVAIDDNGLARIKSGIISGQVKITCTYPKKSKTTMPIAAIQMLLGPIKEKAFSYFPSIFVILFE